MLRAIFISVRTGSTRLPNKSILKIKDKFTIEYVINSVKQSKYADKIILCTTNNSHDDILCDIAKDNGIDFYRGDEHNKFRRWYWASVEFDIDVVVTADGDDLFYDSKLADICFEQIEDNDVINGQGLYNDVYGFKSHTLQNILDILRNKIVEPHEAIEFLKDKNFKINDLKDVPNFLKKKNIRMTLDYQEDFEFFKTIIENLNDNFTFNDVLNYIEDNKSVVDINYFRETDWKENQ